MLLSVMLAACGGSEDLNRFGAPGAHRIEFTIELRDDRLIVAQGASEPGLIPVLLVPAHSDVTFRIENAGDEPHSLHLWASEQARDLLAASPEVPPGQSAVFTYHFHDAQEAFLRDEAHPEEIRARVVVE
jgi:hypothetical protein